MMTRNYNIKGRGYSTRLMHGDGDGNWSIPMFRNGDDASLGIFEVSASSPFRAFEIARKQCWDEYSRA
jgi:hypothetical protein